MQIPSSLNYRARTQTHRMDCLDKTSFCFRVFLLNGPIPCAARHNHQCVRLSGSLDVATSKSIGSLIPEDLLIRNRSETPILWFHVRNTSDLGPF